MPDIIIKNGLIVDGTNSKPMKGDLLITGDIISEIGAINKTRSADRKIDASNLVISPGFIDVHSHFDFSYLSDKFGNYSVMQGITTEIVGNCGLGLAPMNEVVSNYYKKYISFVLGSLEIKQFREIEDYMNFIEEDGVSLNVGFLIPQGNVRAYFMGMEDRKPTDTELKKMKELVRRGMKAGAFGLSTGLIYPPGSITGTEEIIELSKVVGEFGGVYTTHMRDEGSGVLDSIRETIRIGKESGAAVQISHMKAAGSISTGKKVKKMLEMIENAREEGMDINGDVYPYTAANSVLSGLLQPWVFAGGQEMFQENLSNEQKRQKIIKEFKDYIWELIDIPKVLRIIPRFIWMKIIMSMLKKRVIITSLMHNHEFEGETLGMTLKSMYPGLNIYDATLNLLKEEDGAVIISMFLMKNRDVIKLMKSPYLMFSTDNLAPSTGKPHPRVLGTYPRILGRCVREQNIISLEEAIWKMTGLPAKKFELHDRGTLEVGKKADVVIFNHQTIIDTATHQDPISFPIGVSYVIVNGEIVSENGQHTRKLPGKVLKFNER
ncbi:MAG: amidohydrolase family protein [Candidatus Lokiarchaeota archaeon]|nr:amidohydrolase family protein [Candidatus Lokiarchaeota archaeon]